MNTTNYRSITLFIFSSLMLLTPLKTISASESTEATLNQNSAEYEAEGNLKYLLGKVLQKSIVLQETYGNFAPYGAALFKGGDVKFIWHSKPGTTIKEPALSIPIIRQTLISQAQQGRIVASAIAYKFQKKGQKQPNLTVELEYQTGLSKVFASQMLISDENKVSWGHNNQASIEPRVFFYRKDEKSAD